jgi:hypothetical protein
MLRVEELRDEAAKRAAQNTLNKRTPVHLKLMGAADMVMAELDEARDGMRQHEADMEIQKGFALEWMLASADGFNPFPK